MPKVIRYIAANIKTVIVICLIIALAVLYCYQYNLTYEIQYTYKGIKYQAGNLDTGQPVQIEINGIYKPAYFGNPDSMFKGKIIIDGELCYGGGTESDEYAFNKYKITDIKSNSFEGMIFIGDKPKEVTIEIWEPADTGNMRFSYKNSWLISAPAENREEAVNISNKLIQKLHKDVIIK